MGKHRKSRVWTMNAPDNIYVQPCTEIVLRGITSVMATVEKAETDDSIRYVHHDIYAAVEAERDKLLIAIAEFRSAFVIAVGDQSPFAKIALGKIDGAILAGKPPAGGEKEQCRRS